MYRIERTVTLKNSAYLPRAIGWSAELNKYVNDNYKGFNLKFGVEMFGKARMHWMYESESLAKLEEGNARLMQDKKYWTMMEGGKEFFAEGSLQETIINIVG